MALRVLHCPSAVGGHPVTLARAEREVGLASRSICLTENPFGYPADETVWRPEDGPIRRELARWRVFWRALRDFDVIHFNFGSSLAPPRVDENLGDGARRRFMAWFYDVYAALLSQRDLPALCRAGKVIAVTYQGSDARQRAFTLSHLEPEIARQLPPDYFPPGSDDLKERMIAGFSRHAHLIYALNPDLLHVLPERATFLPYANVDPRAYRVSLPDATRSPVVVHAPSRRANKGTAHIVRAVDRLRDEGVDFDFILVEGTSNVVAQDLVSRADVVVDQVLAGWYGGIAVEAMAQGKPLVVRLSQPDLRFLPPEMRDEMPMISAGPDTITEVLRALLTVRRHELSDLGLRSRRYVERWHDPVRIAERLRDDYLWAAATRRPVPLGGAGP
jgi:hypothetical protein